MAEEINQQKIKESLNNENSTLILGDCNIALKTLETNSVDCIITDPPYGITGGRGNVFKKAGKMTAFYIGEWDKSLPLDWIKEAIRVLKPGCWIVIFTANLSVTKVWETIEEAGGNCKQLFYWVKTNPPPQPRKNFCSAIETAVLATKGAVKKWNSGGWNLNYHITPTVNGKVRTNHPTQKPVALMEYLINILTEKGDVVLDPFMGSGTTGIACEQLGRNFVGIEIDEHYFNIAKERIENNNQQKASKLELAA